MLQFLDSLADFLFPPLCHICHAFIPDAGKLHICPECLGEIQFISEPACEICGTPFFGAGDSHICGRCLTDRPFFDLARAAAVYGGGVRQMIHAFKYDRKTHLRRPLALLTISATAGFISEEKPEIILPVPLHVERLRQRGFNQAVLLGELISREFRIPMERRTLLRLRRTMPQVALSVAERMENVKNAFGLSKKAKIEGRKVLLVDDVFTTGSTVDECSRILKKSGVARVCVLTVARAING